MTEFLPSKINPTQKQLQRLATGYKIRLKLDQLSGGDGTVLLTKTQLKKIEKCVHLKKGVDLYMSQNQIEHQIKTGAGLWSKIKYLANKFVPYSGLIAKNVFKLGGVLANYGLEEALIEAHVPESVVKIISSGVQYGSDTVGNALQKYIDMLTAKSGEGLPREKLVEIIRQLSSTEEGRNYIKNGKGFERMCGVEGKGGKGLMLSGRP